MRVMQEKIVLSKKCVGVLGRLHPPPNLPKANPPKANPPKANPPKANPPPNPPKANPPPNLPKADLPKANPPPNLPKANQKKHRKSHLIVDVFLRVVSLQVVSLDWL